MRESIEIFGYGKALNIAIPLLLHIFALYLSLYWMFFVTHKLNKPNDGFMLFLRSLKGGRFITFFVYVTLAVLLFGKGIQLDIYGECLFFALFMLIVLLYNKNNKYFNKMIFISFQLAVLFSLIAYLLI